MRNHVFLFFLCAGALVSSMTVSAQEVIANQGDGEESFSKWRIGGYGEMNYTHMDYGTNRYSGSTNGSARADRGTVAIPRFSIEGDYKFNERWRLGAEVEFESGGTGSAAEVEQVAGDANGEAVVGLGKGGEIGLEEFFLSLNLSRGLNFRFGHFVVPVGLSNEFPEPLEYFGTKRAEGECAIVPNTWNETGVEINGELGRGWYGFSYQAQVVAGVTADAFSTQGFIGSSSQNLFEQDHFSSPAYVGRLNYHGVPGLRVGASVYYVNDASKNSCKPDLYNPYHISVLVYSADIEYKNDYLTARASYLQGEIGNSGKLTAANVDSIASSTGLFGGESPVASRGLTYSGEVGVNVGKIVSEAFSMRKSLTLYPFVRYEYYNPFYAGSSAGKATLAGRQEVSLWTVGVNWFVLPSIVVKIDWTTRHIGTQNVFRNKSGYHSENDFSIGIAYEGLFAEK